jgi:hypothetical protein
MEKHEPGYTSAKKPRATVQATLKANRVDPAEKTESRQEGIDWQAVERAENEGMSCSPGTGNHVAPCDELRRGRESGWLDARQGVTPVIRKGGY